MKIAVVNCADTGPLESLAVMMKSAGYEVRPLSYDLAVHLRAMDLDNIRTINQTMQVEGVERPAVGDEATVRDLRECSLYVDVKAHRNGPKLWKHYPHLKNRTLWYRINGGKPEMAYRGNECMGDEINPPCPILTPNLWYNLYSEGVGVFTNHMPWADFAREKAYATWPPFYRFDEYLPKHPRRPVNGQSICLVHNLAGWGYGAWASGCRALGVRIHGYRSPDGLIDHSTLKGKLATVQAMVHLKRSDAPGYALYEALSAACPIIVSERLVRDNRMEDLFIDEETCLFFDRLHEPDLTHSNLRPNEVAEGVTRIGQQLDRLRDPNLNHKIGFGGREQLSRLMWREERDGAEFVAWMRRVFP